MPDGHTWHFSSLKLEDAEGGRGKNKGKFPVTEAMSDHLREMPPSTIETLHQSLSISEENSPVFSITQPSRYPTTHTRLSSDSWLHTPRESVGGVNADSEQKFSGFHTVELAYLPLNEGLQTPAGHG